jgi:predicted MPP superfamily phosphohydrolase
MSRPQSSRAGQSALDRQRRWQPLSPRIDRQLPALPGPSFQYYDAVGFEWNTYRISVPQLPAALNGLRILHLSDLHCQPHWQSAYDDLLDRIHHNEPDLILITGDIVDWISNPLPCLPTANKLLAQLRAPLGVFAVTGNHDEWVYPEDFLQTPVRFIQSQRLVINCRGEKIELIGIPGPFRSSFKAAFEKSLPAKTPGIPRIILSHFPDQIRRLRRARADLFLSGHTHGGQICLPGMIPIIRHDSLPMKYFLGIHEFDEIILVVNRGLGFSTRNVRIFCPAEVVEVRLGNAE